MKDRRRIAVPLAHKLDFALVIHNHQPVDNEDKVIEQVYRMSYSPFLKSLSKFPRIKANLHYSGYLLEWIERHHPDFISLLRKMVSHGQIEILGGGYYEPILTSIPDQDSLGQIHLLNEKIEKVFGSKARGLWLAERAWEPSAPEILDRSGISYTLLDDTIFQLSGISEERCYFPYVVESRGHVVTVFPLLKKLRYFIPFKPVKRTISFLEKIANEDINDAIAVFADDGEKFGAWPTTYEEVYARGWLRTFFQLLEENEEWLSTVLLSEKLSRTKSFGRVHLPSASYPELMRWSLIVNEGKRDAKQSTGFWRLFLSKYSESGQLYARMLSVSSLIHHLGSGTAKIKSRALKELWKAQYNDVYWHGIFGGLYFPKFRRVAYHHLIRAQAMAESWFHRKDQKDWVSFEKINSSASIDTSSLGVRVSPLAGGSVTEIDYKTAALNFLDVLTRVYESYHDDIVKRQRIKTSRNKITSIHELAHSKESGLSDLLVYDRYPRTSFLDHVVKPSTTISDFSNQRFQEIGHFSGYPYKCHYVTPDRPTIVLSRDSEINDDSKKTTFRLRKEISITSQDTINFGSEFHAYPNRLMDSPEGIFAIEINFGSLGDSHFMKKFAKPVDLKGSKRIELDYRDLGVSVVLDFAQYAPTWLIPVRTVSQSESGFESNLQGLSIVPHFDLDTNANEFEMSISIKRKT